MHQLPPYVCISMKEKESLRTPSYDMRSRSRSCSKNAATRLSTVLLFLLLLRAQAQELRPRLLGWKGARDQHVLSHAHLPVHASSLSPGYVAFGDSYSAGIGTSFTGKETDCRQGLGAHPYLLHTDLQPPNSAPESFQWLSCTGASTLNLLSGGPASQIDALKVADLPPQRTFATLSIGGNDLGFFEVLNACVFRFYARHSGICATALADCASRIRDPAFEHRLSLALWEILIAVRWEGRPTFRLTVTGYARFFDTSAPLPCDEVSLSVWLGGAAGNKLTVELRARMNELVEQANTKIAAVVEGVNRRFVDGTKRVYFVDYDGAFDGHRFCEPGVQEPDYGRSETWFFLPGGDDNGALPPNGTQSQHALRDSSSSPLVEPEACLEPAQRSGDWGRLALCYMATAKKRDPSLQLARVPARIGVCHVPTYYGKTFHPRSLGHQAIKTKIFEIWDEHGYRP